MTNFGSKLFRIPIWCWRVIAGDSHADRGGSPIVATKITDCSAFHCVGDWTLLRLSAWWRTVHFIIFCYIVIHRNCAELKWGSEKVAYSSLVVRSKTLWAEANWERIQVSRKYFLIKRIKIWPEEEDRPSHRSFPVFNYQPTSLHWDTVHSFK